MENRKEKIRQLSISAGALLIMVWMLNYSRPMVDALTGAVTVQQNKIKSALVSPLHGTGELTDNLRFPLRDGGYQKISVTYTLDKKLQKKMTRMIRRWKPDYCAFVALDAETGEILTMVSQARVKHTLGNLALWGNYPAASVFKVVTAAAALDSLSLTPDSIISYNGGSHTLYRRNVTSRKTTRWTRKLSFRKAFAKSINTIFGKVGIDISANTLEKYATRFLFNKNVPGDLPVQPGSFLFRDREDPFNIAEIASGFNREVTMSPLQGALIASVAANDGVMMTPHLVKSLHRWDGAVARNIRKEPLYVATPQKFQKVVSSATAANLRVLMKETIEHGTAYSAFLGIANTASDEIFEIGGKTGTLRGSNPKGSNDWFVGYVLTPNRRIAIAALSVNIEKWRIKSAVLARQYIEWAFPRKRKKKKRSE